MKERKLTCIICPRGCQLSVSEDSEGIGVEGNFCPRGRAYAIDEVTDPKRTVTSTARDSLGGVVSVKTDKPIRRADVMECMRLIGSLCVELPVHIGDVICEDAFGARIVATQNKE